MDPRIAVVALSLKYTFGMEYRIEIEGLSIHMLCNVTRNET
jgi:hypothetical protein